MYKQTEDNRQGMYEGVIACYLAEYIDSDEFWEVIDNHIYAEHETVVDFIEWVTEGRSNLLAWLEEDKSKDLILACPTLEKLHKTYD